MANIIQKLLYFFSAVAPVCITFSVVWIIQGKGIMFPSILVSASIYLLYHLDMVIKILHL